MTPSLSACLGGGWAGGHSTPGALSGCALPSAGAPSVRDQGRAPLISGGLWTHGVPGVKALVQVLSSSLSAYRAHGSGLGAGEQ